MKRPELFKFGQEYIDSMKELMLRYKQALAQGCSKSDIERKNNQSCLLCKPLNTGANQRSEYHDLYHLEISHQEQFKLSCSNIGCPWIVMLDMPCDNWSKINYPDQQTVYHTSDPLVINRRIRQLSSWIKAYKKLL
jgi:hypothetical protein